MATDIISAAKTSSAATADIAAKTMEQTMNGLKDGMAQATSGIAQTQAKLKEGSELAINKANEIVRLGQGNIEALAKSTQIWVAGVQDLSQQVAASFQASVQDTMATFKTLGSVKSLKEAIDLQSSFARTSIEKAISESGRLTEASLQLTKQALAPIVERVSVASGTFGKTV
jgi:phasin family protein